LNAEKIIEVGINGNKTLINLEEIGRSHEVKFDENTSAYLYIQSGLENGVIVCITEKPK